MFCRRSLFVYPVVMCPSSHTRPCTCFVTYDTTQVLRYNPNALRFDTATLASKLVALRKAGLSPSIVRSIVRDAPRCLSAGAKSLGDRVSTLKKAFPSIPLERLLGETPCLLQKQIVPEHQARRGIACFACCVGAWKLACVFAIFSIVSRGSRFLKVPK